MYLISFKETRFAYTFVDYMAIKGIVIRTEFDKDGNCQLFLDEKSQDKLELVRHELELYIKNPNDQRYIDATWQKSRREYAKINPNVKNNFWPKIVTVGPITLIITVICIALYLLLFAVGPLPLFTYLGYPISGYYGEVWRYLTPIFIHFSLMHIIFNLMWWWYLGGMIEKLRGKFKLVEIVVIAGVLSNYAEAMTSGPYFGGLSGVVYALMGYTWLYGEQKPLSGLRFERTMIGIAVIWLLAGYLGIIGNIANTAHLVGLIVGLLLAAKDIWIIKKN